MVDVQCAFISSGCTRRAHALASSSLRPAVLFASARDIVVLRLEPSNNEPHVTSTTAAHKGEVTCLRRASSSHDQQDEELFTTGSADGGVAVWRFDRQDLLSAFIPSYKAHVSSCCFATSFRRSKNLVVTVSCASDGTLVYWHDMETKDEVKKKQNISRSKDIALCADLALLPNGNLVLALGASKRLIDIFYESDTGFEKGVSVDAHQDWVNSVAFNSPVMSVEGSLLLASSSHDQHVKLWRLERTSADGDPDELIVTRRHFTASSSQGQPAKVSVSLEAVLAGHEDWVMGVEWEMKEGEKRLVSSSADKAILVWEEVLDSATDTHIWTETVRLGMVGGHAVGFYGAVWSMDSKALIANSYFGGLHMWRSEDEKGVLWEARSIPSGHFGPVRDLAWEPGSGHYLLTCSQDQTTRAFVPRNTSYVELARPQVHGHDLQCITTVNAATFVSGAEEKISRAFTAPKTFAESMRNVSIVDVDKIFEGFKLSDYGATQPALGLSNKGTGAGDQQEEEVMVGEGFEGEVIRSLPQVLTEPPTEDCLQQNTLWPEVHKLYGHGFELFALAANPRGTLVASACKASHAEYAEILLWSTCDWSCGGRAKGGHELTVTQIAFSPDGSLLLSVSRDRTPIIYREKNGNLDGFEWERVWQPPKKMNPHTRIIWTCAWGDEKTFTTGSRDQKLVVWHWMEKEKQAEVAVQTMTPASVNAVDMKSIDKDRFLVAAGLETGELLLFTLNDNKLSLLAHLDNNIAHSDTIHRIRFRPGSSGGLELATASADHKVKVFRIQVK